MKSQILKMTGWIAAGIFLVLSSACSSGQHGFDYARTENPSSGTLPANVPVQIYIENFDLGSTALKEDHQLISRPHPLRDLLNPPKDPQEQLQEYGDLLAKHLVDELHDRKLPAERLLPGQPVPTQGWRVSGAFLEVDQGNRLQRAAVGFGLGASETQLYVAVTDLSQPSGQKQAFSDFNMDSSTGNGPGGLVMVNPYAMAAKFALQRDASEQDIKRAAYEIAEHIQNLTKGIQDAGAAKP